MFKPIILLISVVLEGWSSPISNVVLEEWSEPITNSCCGLSYIIDGAKPQGHIITLPELTLTLSLQRPSK